MKLHKFRDLVREKDGPGALAEYDRAVAKEVAAMELSTLREELGVTQEELAEAIEVVQTQVSRMERREDHRVSTLKRYVEALGGKLEVAAIIKGRRVVLKGV
jgi:predicted transcriptional regulator